MIEKKCHSKENNGKNGKIGRNEMCRCGSGKKYKKCCEVLITETKYTLGQTNLSDKCKEVLEYLNSQENYSNYRFIDITDDLTPVNYREYQMKNYNNNIVMIAEKKENNMGIFIERDKEEFKNNDMIIMRGGSYRLFCSDNIGRYNFSGFL